MFTQVGTCPNCGAPVWAESPWWGITPPPVSYSCACARSQSAAPWTGPLIIVGDNTNVADPLPLGKTISVTGTMGQ